MNFAQIYQDKRGFQHNLCLQNNDKQTTIERVENNQRHCYFRFFSSNYRSRVRIENDEFCVQKRMQHMIMDVAALAKVCVCVVSDLARVSVSHLLHPRKRFENTCLIQLKKTIFDKRLMHL